MTITKHLLLALCLLIAGCGTLGNPYAPRRIPEHSCPGSAYIEQR